MVCSVYFELVAAKLRDGTVPMHMAVVPPAQQGSSSGSRVSESMREGLVSALEEMYEAETPEEAAACRLDAIAEFWVGRGVYEDLRLPPAKVVACEVDELGNDGVLEDVARSLVVPREWEYETLEAYSDCVWEATCQETLTHHAEGVSSLAEAVLGIPDGAMRVSDHDGRTLWVWGGTG